MNLKTKLLTLMTGGGILNNRLFSVKSDIRRVADIIINFNGLFFLFLKGTIRDKKPIRMSVYTLLSWASSNIITEYFVNRKSWKQKKR